MQPARGALSRRSPTPRRCRPRYDFDLPILALDLVVAANRVTLAVVDACPLSRDLSLPRHYMQTMIELQARGGGGCKARGAPQPPVALACTWCAGVTASAQAAGQRDFAGVSRSAPAHCPPPPCRRAQEELLEEPATSRRVPEWGQAIFSPLAVCMTPESPAGLVGFLNYCVALTRAHIMVRRPPRARAASAVRACSRASLACMLACLAWGDDTGQQCAATLAFAAVQCHTPPPSRTLPPRPHPARPQYASLLEPLDPRTKDGARRLAGLAAGHQRFVSQQLANQKTARVLDKAFGPELTEAYMKRLMFDFEPGDSPPWYDTSVSRLYQHMRQHPEPWADGEQLLAIRQRLDTQKAQLFLERCGRGGGGAGGGGRAARAQWPALARGEPL